MWSEELNNKIRKAAEHHIPEYDESAWVKMEALLDKNLHLKKGSRKKLPYIFFLCFFIIGGTLLLNKQWNRKISDQDLKTAREKSAIANEKNLKTESKDNFSTKDPKAVRDLVYSNRSDKKNKTVLPATGRKNFADRAPILFTQNPLAFKKEKPASINTNENKSHEQKKENVKNRWLPDAESKMQDKTGLSSQNKNKLITPPAISQEKIVKDSFANNVDASMATVPTAPGKPLQKKIENKNIPSRFSFSVSAGADVSGVGLNDPGKVTISYGAGIGYIISKRFSIKSGLYAANKIYSSGPEEYNPTTGYWANVDLKKVDADCKVYEIPLTVYYSFKQKKHHQWFAALGSSSYLMKKETYHFLYKNQAGNLIYHDWTLNNKNKHYFSVITLSGGYMYRLNKIFSLMAEPYVKIPIGGIGYGKVKLKSAGIMCTLSAAPF